MRRGHTTTRGVSVSVSFKMAATRFWVISLLSCVHAVRGDGLSAFLQDHLNSKINFRVAMRNLVTPVHNRGENAYELVGGAVMGLDNVSVLDVTRADKEGVVFHAKFDKLDCKYVGFSLVGTPSFYLGQWTSTSTDTSVSITLSLSRSCTVHNTRVEFLSLNGFDKCTTCYKKKYVGIDTEDVLRRFREAIDSEIKTKMEPEIGRALNSVSLKGQGVAGC